MLIIFIVVLIDLQRLGLIDHGKVLEALSHIAEGGTVESDYLSEGMRRCYLQQSELNISWKKSLFTEM